MTNKKSDKKSDSFSGFDEYSEFNTDGAGDGGDESGDEGAKGGKSSEFAQMLAESFGKKQKKLSVGDKVRGEILVLGKEDVFVSTGTMNDGVVQRRDLEDAEGNVTHKVGDVLDLFVTYVRGTDIRLSSKATGKNLADDLEDAYDMMLPVEGRVAEVCKGGFRVAIKGKMAFCPVSQMDLKFVETPEEYVGQKFNFKITKFAEGGRNIVVSRRRILEEERQLSAGTFSQDRKVGDVVPGRVARLEKFGAFVEIAPGVDGLLHISELSWSRVNDPAEVVQPGQEVQVKILKIEGGGGEKLKISLSLKQAGGTEPWSGVASDIKPGQMVSGKVTRCMPFGAFVELSPGVEGLIPLSEMSFTKRVERSDELFKVGDTVTVMVKEINPETRRIGLSLKAAAGDPWAQVAQKFPVGTMVKGQVERREQYGLFIKLEGGVTALLPKSKAMENPEFPYEKLKVGDETTVQIGELRLSERRISLQPPGDASREDWKAYQAQGGNAGSGSIGFGALADKLKASLDKKKKN